VGGIAGLRPVTARADQNGRLGIDVLLRQMTRGGQRCALGGEARVWRRGRGDHLWQWDYAAGQADRTFLREIEIRAGQMAYDLFRLPFVFARVVPALPLFVAAVVCG
jgi:hypothetical protein